MERRAVERRQPLDEAHQAAIEAEPAGGGEIEAAADAALGELCQHRAIAGGKIGAVTRQRLAHLRLRQRLQREDAAARADGRQEPAGIVAHQQQHRLLRRLLKDLQHGIGGVPVHHVGAIHDDDAPAALGRGEAQEGGDAARVVDDDLAAQLLALGIEAALDHQQIGMAARGDAAEHGMLGRDGERDRRRREQAGGGRALGEEEAREAEGERRLADAARAAQQPGMRQPAGAVRLQQRRLGHLVPEQQRVVARRHDRLRLASGLVVAPLELVAVACVIVHRRAS